MKTTMLSAFLAVASSTPNFDGLNLTKTQIQKLEARLSPAPKSYVEPKDPETACFAVALAGGGDRIAYEAGVLGGFVAAGATIPYSVVSGISTGTILATALRLFPIGTEPQAVQFVQSFLGSVVTGTGAVYKDWPYGDFQGLFFKSGIKDSSPLAGTIAAALAAANVTSGALPNYGPLTRTITSGVVDLNDGAYSSVDLETNTIQDIMASTAIAGVFAPVVTSDGKTLVDGGLRFGVDIFNAVKGCRAKGVPDASIVVDVIVGAKLDTLSVVDASKFKTLQINARKKSIEEYDAALSDINDALNAYPDVNFRYLVSPKEELPGDGLQFDPADLQKQAIIGAQDGAAAVQGLGEKRFCDLSTNVACSTHRDCANWATLQCFPAPVASAVCNDRTMQCTFSM